MVAYSILVTAQGPLVLVLGLKGLGPGLDNSFDSALKICLVAVMVLTTNARHAKRTRPSGHAKILSLIEKMKQRLPASGSVTYDCPGMICPGDVCCPDDSLICCDEDSAYICVEDADTCDECPGMMCPGPYGDDCCYDDSTTCCDATDMWVCQADPDDCNNPDPRTKKNPLLMKTRRQDMHAAKAPANGHAKKNLWARTVGKKNLL